MSYMEAYRLTINVALIIDKNLKKLKEGYYNPQGVQAQLMIVLAGAWV